jgi:L-lactate dehydrogenase complex protein LldG
MTDEPRRAILGSLRDALRDRHLPDASSHPGSFPLDPSTPPPGDAVLVERFGRELESLTGIVHRVSSADEAVAVVLDIAGRHRAERVLAWNDGWPDCPGLDAAMQQAGVEAVNVDVPQDTAGRRSALDAIEPVAVGVTGAFAGLADTGSLVLTAAAGRSRMASLLPPVHIAVLARSRIYATLPAFLAAHPGIAETTSNLVLVTGPSRTADIEMTITLGVHGPREVHVIVVG